MSTAETAVVLRPERYAGYLADSLADFVHAREGLFTVEEAEAIRTVVAVLEAIAGGERTDMGVPR